MNPTLLADKIALKELVAKVSIYGDQKELQKQLQLFTEDAVSKTYVGNELILNLSGKAAMEKAFPEFLANFHTLFHCNGQQIVDINGNEATGTCYCQITLLGTENGKNIEHSIKAIYHDTYKRVNNEWLIAERIGNFVQQDKK